MDLALILSALMLGIAGAPHCAAMCGPASGSLLQGCRRHAPVASPLAFHLARVASYAAAGGVAASSVGALAQLGQLSPVLRPLWTLLQVAAFALGLWLLIRGRQPAWVENFGRNGSGGKRIIWMQGPAGAAAAGSMWVALPCGLLQSALVVAALGSGPVEGAVLMALFAAGSALGLWLGPALWLRLAGRHAGKAQVLAIRAAGLMLAGASGWALAHGLATAMGSDFCLPF